MEKQAYIEWKLKLERLQADQTLAAHVAVEHLLTDRPDLAKQRAEEFAELGREINAHIEALKQGRGGSDV